MCGPTIYLSHLVFFKLKAYKQHKSRPFKLEKKYQRILYFMSFAVQASYHPQKFGRVTTESAVSTPARTPAVTKSSNWLQKWPNKINHKNPQNISGGLLTLYRSTCSWCLVVLIQHDPMIRCVYDHRPGPLGWIGRQAVAGPWRHRIHKKPRVECQYHIRWDRTRISGDIMGSI